MKFLKSKASINFYQQNYQNYKLTNTGSTTNDNTMKQNSI